MRLVYARLSDEKLMRLLKKGKEGAFDVLYRRYFGKLFGYFYRSTGDDELSGDLAQEVLIKVFRSSGRYEEKAKFTTFLYTIARNTLLNHFRDDRESAHRAGGSVGEREIYDFALETTPSDSPDPEQVVYGKELASILEEALETMPEHLKTPFLMAQVENLSYREIGSVMGITEQAVKLRIFRARNHILGTIRERVGET